MELLYGKRATVVSVELLYGKSVELATVRTERVWSYCTE